MNDNSEDAFLTAKEISDWLRIPLNTIYRLTKSGNIKGVKIGKQWRYDKYDFEKYMKGETDLRNVTRERFKERRAYPRMNCNFKCRSRVDILKAKDIRIDDGYIINVSGNGAFLKTNSNLNQINIGDPIDIDFNLTSDIEETVRNIHAKGRVVRKTYNGVGIKFRHIDGEYMDLITQFVN